MGVTAVPPPGPTILNYPRHVKPTHELALNSLNFACLILIKSTGSGQAKMVNITILKKHLFSAKLWKH